MRLASPETPVHASWLAEQGYRLDPGPYISAAYAARKFLQRMPRTETLGSLAKEIFHPGRFRRHWTTDPEHGVKFLGSADIFEADLSSLPMITKDSFAKTARLRLESGWTLITCSGMTAGRVTYARNSMDGSASSQDVMRVVPNRSKIAAGYLYTVLASRYGIPIIRGGVYGTSVRHIEPRHLVDLPVPRLSTEAEDQIDGLISASAALRQYFEDGIAAATRDLFESAGVPELLDLRWHEQDRDTDFSVAAPNAASLRALNHSPRAQRILRRLESVPHRTLGEICKDGYLGSGARFKRVDSDPAHGARLVGQRQGFWMRPEGRWIDPRQAPSDVYARDETVLVAAQGTLGETEVFCRPILATGSWLKNVYTQHFLRIVSGDAQVPGAYLFAFFRSEAAFRVLRSMSTGGKQQDIHEGLRSNLPIPICAPTDLRRIADTIRSAYGSRDEADQKEDEAFALLDRAVREVAG